MTKQLSLFEDSGEPTVTIPSCQFRRKGSSKRPPPQQLLFPELIGIAQCKELWQGSIDTGRTSSKQARHYEKGQVVAVGRKGIPIGEDASQAKFLDTDVAQVFALREEGYSFAQIGFKLDMGKSTAWAIYHGRIRAQFPADYRRIHEKRKKE